MIGAGGPGHDRRAPMSAGRIGAVDGQVPDHSCVNRQSRNNRASAQGLLRDLLNYCAILGYNCVES